MTEVDSLSTVGYGTLLRNRNYAALWLGQLVSTLGDRLHQVALLALVGTLTSQNLSQVALVFAAIGLPSLLFGVFAGALVDRWDRKSVMIASDLIRAPLVLAIPLMARLDIIWVYVLTFLLTTVSLFFRPAKGAVIPDIVPKESLMKANSLSAATDTVMDVLGYLPAAFIVGGLSGLMANDQGITFAFYVDAATYLLSAALIAQMSVSSERNLAKGQQRTDGLLRMVRTGVGFLRSNAVLYTNTIIFTCAVFLAYGSWTLTYGYAARVTGTGAFGYAILEAATGLGATIGAIIVGRWGMGNRHGHVILGGLLLLGTSTASLALFSNMWLASVMLALAGAGNMFALIPSTTLVQQLTPSELRGRVIGFRSALITSAFILSNTLVGLAAERFGVQPMWAVTGCSLVLLALLAFLIPSARNTG